MSKIIDWGKKQSKIQIFCMITSIFLMVLIVLNGRNMAVQSNELFTAYDKGELVFNTTEKLNALGFITFQLVIWINNMIIIGLIIVVGLFLCILYFSAGASKKILELESLANDVFRDRDELMRKMELRLDALEAIASNVQKKD